jgi:plasmid stability protein
MAASLSIDNVPDDVVRRIRERALRNGRSVQGELLSILKDAAGPEALKLSEIRARIKALGLETGSDSVRMIREDRDAR